MAAAKHTPGPWTVAIPSEWPGRQETSIRAEGWGVIASCGVDYSLPHCVEQQKANARLMAAAPELLAVAHDLNEVLAERGLFCECGEADCRTTRLRAALAKVYGSPAC